jgi:hypothetical protein
MKSGQTIFFKESNNWLINKIIKFCTNSDYIHVGIVYGDGLYIIESQIGSNRNINPMNDYNGRKYIVLDTTHLWEQNKQDILQTVSKIKYGYFDLFAVGMKNLLGRIGIDIKVRDYAGEICSEYVSKCFKLPETQISPVELFDMLIDMKINIIDDNDT